MSAASTGAWLIRDVDGIFIDLSLYSVRSSPYTCCAMHLVGRYGMHGFTCDARVACVDDGDHDLVSALSFLFCFSSCCNFYKTMLTLKKQACN